VGVGVSGDPRHQGQMSRIDVSGKMSEVISKAGGEGAIVTGSDDDLEKNDMMMMMMMKG
jgi:hypothetical protein